MRPHDRTHSRERHTWGTQWALCQDLHPDAESHRVSANGQQLAMSITAAIGTKVHVQFLEFSTVDEPAHLHPCFSDTKAVVKSLISREAQIQLKWLNDVEFEMVPRKNSHHNDLRIWPQSRACKTSEQ